MSINYILITISFFVPIIRLGFTAINTKNKISPRIFVMEWIASGFFACLVQFLGFEIPFIHNYQTTITVVTALFAKKIFTFADENLKPIMREFLGKLIQK